MKHTRTQSERRNTQVKSQFLYSDGRRLRGMELESRFPLLNPQDL